MQTATNVAGNRLYTGSTLYHDIKLENVTPQAQKVYNLMARDGHVTRLTALHYSIANLTARIAELRAAGIAVECELRTDANGNEYGRWFLAKA